MSKYSAKKEIKEPLVNLTVKVEQRAIDEIKLIESNQSLFVRDAVDAWIIKNQGFAK